MLWIANTFSLQMLGDSTGALLSVRDLSTSEARALAANAAAAVSDAERASELAHHLGLEIPPNRGTVRLEVGDSLLVGEVRDSPSSGSHPIGTQVRWRLVQVTSGPSSLVTTPSSGAASAPVECLGERPRDVDGPSEERGAQASVGPEVDLRPASGEGHRPEDGGPTSAPFEGPPDTRSRSEILRELTKRVAWNELAVAARERALLLARFPDAVTEAEHAEQDGRDQASHIGRLDALGRRSSTPMAEFEQLAAEILKRWPFLRSKVDKTRRFALAKRANAAQERATTTLRPTRDSRILALKPSARWLVLVDETGANFHEVGAPGHEGRFVAVVVPEETTLQSLGRDFHASAMRDADLDAHLQHLLDSEAGILGVTLRDLPATPGERWVDGVLELVDWVVLLLPREVGAPVVVDVRVEQRGSHVSGRNWELAAREIQRRHAIREPESVAGLDLRIGTYPKSEPLLAYADLVAHTWSARNDVSRLRLSASGLRGTCLMEGSAPALRALWSGFSRHLSLAPEAWAELLSTPGVEDPFAVAGLLSLRLQERTRERPELWQAYLGAALAHMDSKALELPRLGAQLDWLAAAAPETEGLPVVARHAWALARLDAANHRGQVEAEAEREVHELGERLLDERSPRVCEGDLRRAVLATNRFDFAGASAALARWEGVPLRIPGLQMWGRVQSSLGQHLAFEGRLAEARARFESALEAFSRLSDPSLSASEQSQTRTYLAIATMDDPSVSDAEVRDVLEATLGPFVDAVARLGPSVAARDKYALHLLLRWAVHRGDEGVDARILRDSARWASGVGHPWPLICLYRGLLMERRGAGHAAREQIRRGMDLAWTAAQGPLIRFIGLVVATVLAARGERDPRIPVELARARGTLPAALDRIMRVERELERPGLALDFLRDALPFNFR
jgi:hypothetical protein